MENLRERVEVRLVTDVNQFIKLTSKPTFVSSKIFSKNLVAIHKIKETLKLNRPAYVGMCILDLSKTLMYDFHYNYIKKEYGNKTNDLILNLTPENVTHHSRIVTTTHKGSSTPTKMSKIIGRQIH